MSISSGENRVAPAAWLNGPDTGCVLKERYELREVRGAGGFGRVYRAKDIAFTILEVSVAVKMAHDRLSVKNRRRFEREANVAAQINHPNIVRVLDYGVLDGRPWFVMPLLTGQSLQLRQGGHWLDMSRLMQQLCSAVHAMHLGTSLSVPGLRTQVLHRDIKPVNCFVTEREHCEPHLTLLDLGLCKLPGVQRLTSVGDMVGTGVYMAPECIVGAVGSTIRSEIYSLGVTFFELLTGELPDPSNRIAGLTDDTISAPDPRALRPELPAALAAIVMRAMAPQLSRRFPDVGVMMTAIAAVIGRVGVRRAPLTAQREGIAPVIPLHPLPYVEPASEDTALRANTVLEPIPKYPPALVAVPAEILAETPVTPFTPERSTSFEARPASPVVEVAAPSSAPRLASPGPLRRRRWIAAVIVAASIAAAAAGTLMGRLMQTAALVEPPALAAPNALRATATRPVILPSSASPPSSPRVTSPTGKTARVPSGAPAPVDAAAIQAAIQAAATEAAPDLRGCPDHPEKLSAQVQVRGRRGTVLMIDGEPVDDGNPWHACVRRELGRVEYPATSSPVKARIRFPLR